MKINSHGENKLLLDESYFLGYHNSKQKSIKKKSEKMRDTAIFGEQATTLIYLHFGIIILKMFTTNIFLYYI